MSKQPEGDNEQFTTLLLRYLARRAEHAQNNITPNNNTNNDDEEDDDPESPASDDSTANSWTESFFRPKRKKKPSPKLDLIDDKESKDIDNFGRLKQWIHDGQLNNKNIKSYLQNHALSFENDHDDDKKEEKSQNNSNLDLKKVPNKNINNPRRKIINNNQFGQYIPYNFTQFMEYKELGLCSMYRTNGCLGRINDELFSNNVIERFQGNARVFCCDFSSDGNVLCAASQDHVIHLIDSSSGCNGSKWPIYKQVESVFSGWSIIDVALSPDHQFVAYSGWSSSIYLVNAYGSHELHTSHDLNISNSWGRCCVFGVEFDPNSKKVICALSGGQLILHDLELKRNQFSLPTAHDDDINQATFLDSNIIISGSDDALLKVWDARNPTNSKCVGGFVGHYQGITCVSTPNDYGSSNYVLSNSKDQSMKLWDLRAMNNLSELKETRQQLQSTTGSFDYRYRGWNSKQTVCHEKKFRLDKSLVTYKGHSVSRTLCRSGFSPTHSTSAKYVYCGSADCTVYIYNTLTAELHSILRAHSDIVRDVCWHPFLPIIISASWDGSVTRWSYKSSEKLGSIKKKKQKKNKQSITLPSTNKMNKNQIDLDNDYDDDDISDSGSDSEDNESFVMPDPVSLDMPDSKRKRNDHDYW